MSRKGAPIRAPFWIMRIRPPCSRTSRRPLPSLGTSIPTGAVRPWTNAERTSAGGPPGSGLPAVRDEPRPQPGSMTRSAGIKRTRERIKEDRTSSSARCGMAYGLLRRVPAITSGALIRFYRFLDTRLSRTISERSQLDVIAASGLSSG